MCGISATFGRDSDPGLIESMVRAQRHRGPDAEAVWRSPSGHAALGHNRLSIIDLSEAGRQPMSDVRGRYWIAFNGEIYNYRELRAELRHFEFRTRTDTEVLLAAFQQWGVSCLDRLVGMFAFVIWDEQERKAFGARDRFGVKPLYLHARRGGGLWVASEIKAFHAAGLGRDEDGSAWASYLVTGMHDHSGSTFWKGVRRLMPGCCFEWSEREGLREWRWYDLAKRVLAAGEDLREDGEVEDDLLALLEQSVRLRLRADVPIGICLSGGLDSSLLLEMVRRAPGGNSGVKTFTFHCDDPRYDERPWAHKVLAHTGFSSCPCPVSARDIPELAARVFGIQDEPYGGIPTVAMTRLHQRAVEEGVVVLLDGNGLDEGWAGYDYYQQAGGVDSAQAPVQGSREKVTRPEALREEFRNLATLSPSMRALPDTLRSLQHRDLTVAKIPRAMRFADRASMMWSRELREPFLDHRVLELGLRQPAHRKIRNGEGKWLVRRLARRILPKDVTDAPKRAVQTPQREWFRGPLRPWVRTQVERALAWQPGWFIADAVRSALNRFLDGEGDQSFFVWQWVSAGLCATGPDGEDTVDFASRDESVARVEEAA